MDFLGVDPSTKALTAVMLDDKKNLVDWWHCPMEGKRSVDRMFGVHNAARQIPWSKADIIAFERPAGRGTQAIMDIWRVTGGCFFFIAEHQPVWEFTPSDWKKKVGLPGNASKEDIFDHAIGMIALNGGDPFALPIGSPQDLYDAYCVCLAAVLENEKGL